METGDAPTTPLRPAARPGGRSARVRLAVVEATLVELTERGYADLSLARVAAGAGVALSTVHRRWGGKAGVASEAIGHLLGRVPEVPPGASADEELHDLATRVLSTLRAPTVDAALRALMLLPLDELTQLRSRHLGLGARLAQPIVERGIARGDLPPGTDPARLAERIIAGIWFRSFVTGLPFDERSIDAFVADALAATRGAAATTAGADGSQAPGQGPAIEGVTR